MKNAKPLSITIFTTVLISACISTPKNIDIEKLPIEHRWDARQISTLENLWLNNLEPKKDVTNRVVNNPDAASLGKNLFFDTRFSADGNIACATCHKPELYFTDGLPQAKGLEQTKRNTPTIVGVSQNTWYFLDGRTDSLWAQAMGPIENHLEHGSSRNHFAHEIYKDADLRAGYEKIFGPIPNISDLSRFPIHAGPIKKDKPASKAWRNMNKADRKIINDIFVNSAKAIAAFETQLQPAPSRFDNYVEALINKDTDKMLSALSINEAAGLKVFISMNKGKCMICHNGPMLTDMEFHNIATPPLNVKRYDYGRRKGVTRVKRNKFNCLSDYNDAKEKSCDELKYMVVHEEETMAAFKTPSLRNVTRTAPYMHGGQYKTLSEVIKHYNDPPSTKVGMSNLLDIDLTDKEMAQLEAFLKTLDSPITAESALLTTSN